MTENKVPFTITNSLEEKRYFMKCFHIRCVQKKHGDLSISYVNY